MSYRGTVRNGVVVLEEGVNLPEGAAVLVTPPAETPTERNGDGPHEPGRKVDIYQKLLDLAVDTGIPDLSVNIDHYLYGHPKVDDAES